MTGEPTVYLMTELLQLRGVVEAPAEQVAAVLLDVRPGGRSPFASSTMTVTTDAAARSVTLQSEWWYRSVTSVEPDPRGAKVIQRIFDVAPDHGWAVRFASRGPLNAAPAAFAAQLDALGLSLNCTAWMVED